MSWFANICSKGIHFVHKFSWNMSTHLDFIQFQPFLLKYFRHFGITAFQESLVSLDCASYCEIVRNTPNIILVKNRALNFILLRTNDQFPLTTFHCSIVAVSIIMLCKLKMSFLCKWHCHLMYQIVYIIFVSIV